METNARTVSGPGPALTLPIRVGFGSQRSSGLAGCYGYGETNDFPCYPNRAGRTNSIPFLIEDGTHREFADQYGAAELPTESDIARTQRNVQDSDATLWFGVRTTLGHRRRSGHVTGSPSPHIPTLATENPPEFLKEPARIADSGVCRHDGKEAKRMGRDATGRRQGSVSGRRGDPQPR